MRHLRQRLGLIALALSMACGGAGSGDGTGAQGPAGGPPPGAQAGSPASAPTPECTSPGSCSNEESNPAAIVDNGDGTVTVTDSFGQLVWLRDANCTDAVAGIDKSNGQLDWFDAATWSGGLADGSCGLRDGSVPGDWRVPKPAALLHLRLALTGENPFTHVQAATYWSSFQHGIGQVGAADMSNGQYFEYAEDELFYVWPVR